MSGSPGVEISSRRRRGPLRVNAGLLLIAGVILSRAAFGQPSPPPVRITLDQAIEIALRRNHNLRAARTTVSQSQAQEITANLRPNPTFFVDWEYLPIFSKPEGGLASYLQ